MNQESWTSKNTESFNPHSEAFVHGFQAAIFVGVIGLLLGTTIGLVL